MRETKCSETGISNIQYDAIVVLGAGVSEICFGRVRLGLELMKSGAAPILVFVGGSTEEAEYVKTLAKSYGIDCSRIHVDVNSKNTVDNAYYAKIILEKFKARRIILVTSEFHMERALAIFEWVLGDEYSIKPCTVIDNPGEQVIAREEYLKMFIPIMRALFTKGDDEGIKKAADLLDSVIESMVR